MNDMNKYGEDPALMEEKLWEFIDGSTNAEENSIISSLVKENTLWRSKYEELLDLKQLLESAELDEPSMRFTRNVMEEISRLHITPAARTYINKRIIWSIAYFFIITIILFLVYGFAQMDWNEGQTKTVGDVLSKIDLSKFFNNTWVNVFMMLNVMLGLFLFDNYLSRKRRAMRKFEI